MPRIDPMIAGLSRARSDRGIDMRPGRLRSLVAAVILLALSGAGGSAQTRTIRIVVPFAPGGGVDVLARVMAEQIGREQGAKHGVTLVVENRPGAGTAIGADAVLRANADGNTLLINNNSFAVIPHLRKLDYDPFTSFAAVCELAVTPSVVVVGSASPYRTLADLIGAARARPGELTFAAAPGAILNVAFEMLKQVAKINLTFVPYPGTAPAVGAVLGGHVTTALVDYPVAAGQLQAGDLRALATGSRTRMEWLAQLPTIAESGYESYEADLWYGLFAPAKAPKETLSQLEDWFAAAAKSPEIRSRLVPQGITPVGMCGAGFGIYLRKQFDDYGRVIRQSNMKMD